MGKRLEDSASLLFWEKLKKTTKDQFIRSLAYQAIKIHRANPSTEGTNLWDRIVHFTLTIQQAAGVTINKRCSWEETINVLLPLDNNGFAALNAKFKGMSLKHVYGHPKTPNVFKFILNRDDDFSKVEYFLYSIHGSPFDVKVPSSPEKIYNQKIRCRRHVKRINGDIEPMANNGFKKLPEKLGPETVTFEDIREIETGEDEDDE